MTPYNLHCLSNEAFAVVTVSLVTFVNVTCQHGSSPCVDQFLERMNISFSSDVSHARTHARTLNLLKRSECVITDMKNCVITYILFPLHINVMVTSQLNKELTFRYI